jgi:hypothetical protein
VKKGIGTAGLNCLVSTVWSETKQLRQGGAGVISFHDLPGAVWYHLFQLHNVYSSCNPDLLLVAVKPASRTYPDERV